MNTWIARFRLPIVFVLVVTFAVIATYMVVSSKQIPPTIVVVPPTSSPVLVKDIKVYVSGAVLKGGVYSVREGARVEDAVRAAGGASPDADMSHINLALRVKDEMQVNVPRVGETSGSAPTAAESDAKVNVNAATAEDLDRLPGIGPATAARIIDYRGQKGSFKRIEDLRDLKLVTTSQYEKIKDHISVE